MSAYYIVSKMCRRRYSQREVKKNISYFHYSLSTHTKRAIYGIFVLAPHDSRPRPPLVKVEYFFFYIIYSNRYTL